MSYIFENALNFDELLSRLLAAAASMDYLFFACAAFFTIERFGRRKVMITSSAACCICWVVISIVLALSDKGIGDTYGLNIVAVAFFFIFFASFGMGILGVTWSVESSSQGRNASVRGLIVRVGSTQRR